MFIFLFLMLRQPPRYTFTYTLLPYTPLFRSYSTAGCGTLTLPGRSLMLIRNVGLHLTTDAVTDLQGNEMPESLVDLAITSAIALHDLDRKSTRLNSSQ